MMRKTLIAGFVLAGVAPVTLILVTNHTEINLSKPLFGNTVLPLTQETHDNVRDVAAAIPADNTTRRTCLPLFGATTTPEQDIEVRAGVQAVIAKKFDVATLVRLSQQGNASAALALFQKVRPCSDATRYLDSMEFDADNEGYLTARECQHLPAALLRNPINILMPAAEAGSTPAKLLIAKNAPTVAAVMNIIGGTSAQEITDLRAIAEKQGLEAARSGSESAMAWLAYGYVSGTFGRQDNAAAYAITQVLDQSRRLEDGGRLTYLYAQMSQTELNDANSLLDQCARQGGSAGSSILRSPFE